MDNTCVCCGEIIPEGAQVCPICSEGDTFRVAMARPVSADFKVKDEVEQAFREGYIEGRNKMREENNAKLSAEARQDRT